MKLTNEEKCVYCREYGNLPCEECDKKLEAKKAMSKTNREDEMIEMLEKVVKILDVNCHKGCDHKSWNDFQNGDGDDVGVEIQIFIDRAKTLLQSLKQPLFSNEAKSN